jgi:superoxide dismutase, Cu-Zn family
MFRLSTIPACLALLAMPACATDQMGEKPSVHKAMDGMDAHSMPTTAPVTVADLTEVLAPIVGLEGQPIGLLTLTGGPNGVLLQVKVSAGGLTPGWHGLHLHQVGDCSDVGEYRKSGGHLGMLAGGHGLLNPDGPKAGDLPNIFAFSDGSANMEAFSTLFDLDLVRDADGAALIIHAERDDHLSQPIGGAGARVACAAIR